MTRLGIFGGTFNPIHLGHINLLKNVTEKLKLDKILIMPTKIPPHKQVKYLASEYDRVEMCKLSIENNSSIEVSDFELNNDTTSYTVLTLRHFKELYPNTKLYFILGSDMLLSFHKWFEYEEILQLATIVCASRNIQDILKIEAYAELLRNKGGECIILNLEPYEISSSQIRDAISEEQDFACYLPQKVVQYIKEKKLYM